MTKPTVIPTTYSIPENPGDRISKLSQTQAKSNGIKPAVHLPPATPTWNQIAIPEPAKALPPEPPTSEAADGVSILEADAPQQETPVAEILTQAVETGTWTEPETTSVESTEAVSPEARETAVENVAEVAPPPVEVETEVLKAAGEPENLVAVEETVGENLLDNLLSEVSEAEPEQAPVEETPTENLAEVEEAPVEETQLEVEETPVAETQPEVEEAPVAETQLEVEETPVAETQPEVEEAPVEAPLTESLTGVEEAPVEAVPEISEAAEISEDSEPATEESATVNGRTLDPDAIICPSCGSGDVRKNGHQNGKQRYACKDCGRQFVETAALSPGDELPTTGKSNVGSKGFGRKMKGKRKK
ncbi:hypothetical protein H6G20_26215 [Desertifilum sp. FACHB-1129]|uniref:IS1/IS1595 family N-terminal zinc-binding domain-containing protein n=1 Tax=Desertifilum tharense TaxID=1185873 RepID=UPI00114D3A1F|nr:MULTISPECIES: hypothetical protein [unclassified Desertifilum]MBD2315167.1 hypothetical protein [Desertifilum sp. FACHB-1129]MBD2321741.1 hypothetical protein [Desertifilum sp. FACHB-866]MBD2331868.1 hypothetical protein [Desertifilum sp. FACHB-868]